VRGKTNTREKREVSRSEKKGESWARFEERKRPARSRVAEREGGGAILGVSTKKEWPLLNCNGMNNTPREKNPKGKKGKSFDGPRSREFKRLMANRQRGRGRRGKKKEGASR